MILDLDTLSLELLGSIVEDLEDTEPHTALEIAREYGEIVGYIADDGNAEVEYGTETPLEAAQEYVDDGDWGGDDNKTSWITVYTWPVYSLGDARLADSDNKESHTITLEPEVPICTEDEHEWVTPWEILGGLKENPGVQGNGGGVICLEICKHCGCLKVTDTWAQNPETGEQGLTAVEYEEWGEHDYSAAFEVWKEEESL
jgi:hypothetical protein